MGGEGSGIREFYTEQSILVTGATGFLGKVITEKLLRTCPRIKRLFLLIRTKKEKDSQQRLTELFSQPVFDVMKKENPNYMEKVILISGDVSLPDNGISESDRRMLIEEVTIVFHGAATVRFDEMLKKAVAINVYGTKQLLKFCSECWNLKAFVHISTAFANCNQQTIKEEIHPPPINGDVIIKLINSIPEDKLEILLPQITYDWPNTYTFTKQVAEDLVRSEAIKNKIPAAIFRPAIVVGANSEPVPGWTDNINGITGIMIAGGIGVLRTMIGDPDKNTEMVPVDLTVNAALAIAWELGKENEQVKSSTLDNRKYITESGNNISNDSVPVYNFAPPKNNSIKWNKIIKIASKYGHKTPTINVLWYYTLTVTKYRKLFFFFHFLFHLLPALLVDTTLLIIWKKPLALKVYQKVQKLLLLTSYFGTHEWEFNTNNTISLWNKLSEKDKELFTFSMDVVDWDRFIENNIKAIRIYVLKDTADTIPAAKRKIIILHLLHRLVQTIFYSFVFWVLWSPTLKLFYCLIFKCDE